MKSIIKIEELAQLIAALLGIYYLPVELSWWLWIVLFFAPDLSMVGYLWDSRVGAILYNLAHHKAVAAFVFFIGFYSGNIGLQVTALLLWAHSSFDRVLGYGLKHMDSFQHTHLGNIGKDSGRAGHKSSSEPFLSN